MNSLVIVQLLHKTFPKNKITYDSEFDTVEVHLKEGTVRISDVGTHKFHELKNKINKAIEESNNEVECNVCCETGHGVMICNECKNNTCLICSIKICEKNNHIFKCPYCRHEVPDFMDNIIRMYYDDNK